MPDQPEDLQEARTMEAVGRLAGGLAHHYNNLLAIILGYSELLLASLPAADPSRLDVEEVKKAGERASALTEHLLVFSGKRAPRLRDLCLNSLVSGIEPELRKVIGEVVELDILLAKDLGDCRADPAQIEQIVLTLADNARDAMPRGGRLVIETLEAKLDGKPCVALRVSDTGLGMDPEALARLFEPFHTSKRLCRGTGLGLATAYAVVRRAGGRIEVRSAPGRGTAFEIRLPRLEAPERP